jgi:hypothetical protein
MVEARQAFLSRNIPGIPIEQFPQYGRDGKEIMMDPRCFIDHFNTLATTTQSIYMEMQNQKHAINDIRNTLGLNSAINNDYIIGKIYNINKSVQKLEKHFLGAPAPAPDRIIVNPNDNPFSEFSDTTANPFPLIHKFSSTAQHTFKEMSVADVTFHFFCDNYPLGYILDKKSDSWNEDQKEKLRLKNLFAKIKRAVRMVLMHADTFPWPAENQTRLQFKEAIKRIARAAEERIRDNLEFGNKTITIYTLPNHPDMKSLEKSLPLPANTPERVRKFFNS